MYLYIVENEIQQLPNMPQSIRLPNGMTRTSLNELPIEQQEELGLFYYEIVTPVFNPMFQHWVGEYLFDSNIRTATKVIIDRPIENIKSEMISKLLTDRAVIQQQGYTCTNTIKLQVDEFSLNRWTQLMTGLIAFQPANLSIRDYDNVTHSVTLATASQMLAEVFMWGQTFIATTWAMKDAITNADIDQLLVIWESMPEEEINGIT